MGMLIRHSSPKTTEDLIKFNEMHRPGGSPEGGQFAPKEGGGGGLSQTQMHNIALDHNLETAYKGFPRAAVSAESKAIEDKSIYRYLTQRNELMQQYYAAHGNKISNADDMRKLFEGYRGTNSEAVHEASSALSKDIWRNNLATNPEKEAWLYAGGSGSGKTTSIQSVIPGITGRAAAIMDFNLSSYNSAKSRIEEAVAAGKDPQIAYVYRDPVDAWGENGVIGRMIKHPEGRVVPLSAFISNTRGSLDTARRLKSEGITVHAIDNTDGKQGRRLMSDSEFGSLSHPSAEAMRSTMTGITNRLYASGRISKEQHDALLN